MTKKIISILFILSAFSAFAERIPSKSAKDKITYDTKEEIIERLQSDMKHK